MGQTVANASFGIYSSSYTGTIYEILLAPMSSLEITISYVGAAGTKSIIIRTLFKIQEKRRVGIAAKKIWFS